jgi:hypothetical protein
MDTPIAVRSCQDYDHPARQECESRGGEGEDGRMSCSNGCGTGGLVEQQALAAVSGKGIMTSRKKRRHEDRQSQAATLHSSDEVEVASGGPAGRIRGGLGG